MIKITINKLEFLDTTIYTFKGHANYAPKGNDIVCAAVSAITSYLGYCVSHSDFYCDYKEYDDTIVVDIITATREGMQLANALNEWLESLAETYKENIELVIKNE